MCAVFAKKKKNLCCISSDLEKAARDSQLKFPVLSSHVLDVCDEQLIAASAYSVRCERERESEPRRVMLDGRVV